ncbi:UNVERIFIED_ORG: hypothetical protein M2442_001352 [Methylorubrum zatmanii]|nr:hypothetical protein [Methylorubrum zatmanii]
MAEQDPVRRDADRLVPASYLHLTPADTKRAVPGMDSEDLWHRPAPKAFDDVGAGLVGVRSGSVPRYRHGEELGRRAPTALRNSAAWGGSALGASSVKSIRVAG